jgi:hypothetical protein
MDSSDEEYEELSHLMTILQKMSEIIGWLVNRHPFKKTRQEENWLCYNLITVQFKKRC